MKKKHKNRKHKSRSGAVRLPSPTDLKVLLDTPPWDWPANMDWLLLRALTDPGTGPQDRLIAAEMAGDLVVMNDALAIALLAIVDSADRPEDLRARAAISFGAVLEQANISEFEDPGDVPVSEDTFHRIQETLKKIHFDPAVPVLVRRRALEASVRATEDWHRDAIVREYESGDRDRVLTAVFCMRWVKGFPEQILEALRNPDEEIHYEAVLAAGAQEVTAARDHIVALIEHPATEKDLLIAAINALSTVAPSEAAEILDDLRHSRDEDIAEAVLEAISMANMMAGIADELDDDEFEDDDDDDEDDLPAGWIN